MLLLRLTTATVTQQEFATCRLAEYPRGRQALRGVARDEGASESQDSQRAKNQQQDGAAATPHGLTTARS